MQGKRVAIRFILAVFIVSAAASVRGSPINLLQNGSFESPVITTNSFVTGTPAQWTAGTNTGAIFNGSASGFPTPEDGAQYADIGNSPSYGISQAFTVATGGEYGLSWFDNSYFSQSTSTYTVTLTSSSAQQVLSDGFNAGEGQRTWNSRNEMLALTPDTYTLNFDPTGATQWDVLLDNASVTGVPEPTVVMLAIAAMAFARRRRVGKVDVIDS